MKKLILIGNLFYRYGQLIEIDGVKPNCYHMKGNDHDNWNYDFDTLETMPLTVDNCRKLNLTETIKRIAFMSDDLSCGITFLNGRIGCSFDKYDFELIDTVNEFQDHAWILCGVKIRLK